MATQASGATPSLIAATGTSHEQAAALADAPHLAAQNHISVVREQANIALQGRTPGIVDELQHRLGDRYAGVWLDPAAGVFEVGVASSADTAPTQTALTDLGLADSAKPVQVGSTWSEVTAAVERWAAHLSGLMDHQQASVGIGAEDVVQVSVSDAVAETDFAALQAAAAQDPVRVDVLRVPAAQLRANADACAFPDCDRPLRGGVGVYGPTGTCTSGFVTFSNSNLQPYILTAGHCFYGRVGDWWWAGDSSHVGHYFGQTHNSARDSSGDTGIIGPITDRPGYGTYYNVAGGISAEVVAWSYADDYPVYGSSPSYVGEGECHEGRTSGVQCGNVTQVDTSQPVNYCASTGGSCPVWIGHLTTVNGCSSEGDSGGPWIDNYSATGIDIAGYGCPNGPAWYMEVGPAASRMNVHIATAG